MQIIVIGCGKVGAKFAKVLSDEGNDIVIVDNDANSFKNLGQSFRGITVTGVPIDQDVLKQAGIETADALTAVTPDDNVNIMVCQVAKEIFKVPRVIARIYNPAREHVFHHFGIETICPTDLTVEVIRSLILTEKEVTRHMIGSQMVAFKQKLVSDKYVGKKVDAVKLDSGMMIFGILREGGLILANAVTKLEKSDILVITEIVY